MLFGGKLQADVEDLVSTTNELGESVSALRDQLRRQQFRISELETALAEIRVLMAEGLEAPEGVQTPAGDPAGAARLKQWEGALLDVRNTLAGVQARLDEHEQGMRWLYQKLSAAPGRDGTGRETT